MKEDILRELYRHDESLPDSMLTIMRREEQMLPEATMGTLADIFRCGEDRPAYSRRLALAGKDGARIGDGDGEPCINTYPFGVPCDTVFPEFVGVCAGQRRLEDVLDRTLEQCERMSQALDTELPKTVTILTDKWHDPKFRKKYDLPLLRYALRYNIFITFWLVTDYGVTRIPFMVRRRDDLMWLRSQNISVEIDPKIARASLLDGNPCTYSWNAGTWRQFDQHHYDFDFEKRTCLCCDTDGRLPTLHRTVKRIPAAAMDRFAQTVQPILELPEDKYKDRRSILDSEVQQASIFGKHFWWWLDGDRPCYRILTRAFRDLINALK